METRLLALEEELNELRNNSAQLGERHLLDCLKRTREDGDEDNEREVKRIMKIHMRVGRYQ